MTSSAIFSPCRRYRYDLIRTWYGMFTKESHAVFIGLNPSTADETQDDPTVRRCIRYAKAWGHSGMHMLNIFAYRATDPKDMLMQDDPTGPSNDDVIRMICGLPSTSVVIAAWGIHGSHMDRGRQVASMLQNLRCLRMTKDGHPAHPLYLPKNLRSISFDGGRS